MAGPSKPTEREPAARLVAATVARGRSVLDLEGNRHAAGAEVKLPEGEVQRLRELGFLVDPKAPAIRLDNGPSFGSARGPQIRRG